MLYAKQFNPIGTLYGCPSVFVAAYRDGGGVVTKESPSGESAFYPTAPWTHRYTLQEFLALPFHKNWRTRMTRDEVELALIGQINVSHREWPHYWKLQYPYSTGYGQTSDLTQLTQFNMNQLQDIPDYWRIGDEIVI